mmetsp:Transcript_4028/g.7754  ORF Transcript_4028/g.7754 Transcript_4028/m.7754 type:complete len:101 (+) Transcript_4028:230-532(+)
MAEMMPPARERASWSQSLRPGFLRRMIAGEAKMQRRESPPRLDDQVWGISHRAEAVRWMGTVSSLGFEIGTSVEISNDPLSAASVFCPPSLRWRVSTLFH